MAQAQSQTIRIRADETSRSAIVDANTNATPLGWARASTTFQLGLASGGALVDVSNLASVTLEAAAYANRDGARVLSNTVAGGALDNTLNESTWDDGSKQHALIPFSAAQMNLLASGVTTADFWLVISGITTSGATIVFAAGKLTINDPGTFFTASTPPANPGAYLTMDQAAALYAPIGDVFSAPAITSVGDNAAGSLEMVPTVGLPVLTTWREFYRLAGDTIETWLLAAGTDATSADTDGNPAVQRPDDYNASTNAKIWKRKR